MTFRLFRRHSPEGWWDLWREMAMDELRDEESVPLALKLAILSRDSRDDPVTQIEWMHVSGVSWRLLAEGGLNDLR